MITPETIDRVREAADIVQIVGEHVKLRRMGSNYRGPCPLHGGKNPNFSVSPDKGFYKCFTCGESGDVFTFLQKVVGCDFVTAVRMVAERSGIEIKEEQGARAADERDSREPFWEVNAAAASYFTATLWESAEAAPARAYLESRNIPRELADRFGLGYAPRGNAAKEHLVKVGYDESLLLEVGLLARRDESGESYAKFRDRLMIPIFDARGHPVGFGGRLLEDREGAAKYLNSPESPVFSKRRLLYNLHAARNAIRKDERAVVVEGYFDVIRLVAAGVESAVAGLGTALTDEHAGVLARITKNVLLLYDSDEAGQKATFRAGRELLAQGVGVRVVSLPDGEDPDTFVARHGAARLEQAFTEAMDLFERQLRILELKGWFAELARTRRAIDRLMPTIRATRDPLTRDLYVSRLSEVAKVDKTLLLREANDVAVRRPPPGDAPRRDEGPPPDWQGGAMSPAPDAPREARSSQFDKRAKDRRWKRDRRKGEEWESLTAPPRATRDPGDNAERLLVTVMLHHPQQIEAVGERLAPEQLRDPRYAEIFAALLERGAEFDREELVAGLTDASARAADAMFAAPDEVGAPVRIVDESITQLRVRQLRAESDDLDRAIARASGEAQDALIAQKQRISAEIRALGGKGFGWFGKLGSHDGRGRDGR
jgi:DNA primase